MSIVIQDRQCLLHNIRKACLDQIRYDLPLIVDVAIKDVIDPSINDLSLTEKGLTYLFILAGIEFIFLVLYQVFGKLDNASKWRNELM